MKAIRIPFQPHSHFHFGDFKVDTNVALSSTSYFAHSDTFFSALVNAYAEGVGNADDFVKSFSTGEINISSLFYYLKKGETIVYLLPKPVFLDLYSPRDGKHKLRNQVKFISNGVWTKGCAIADWDNKEKYMFIQNHDVLLTKKEVELLGLTEKDTVFTIVDIPKSPIRKNDPKDSIYYQADVETGNLKEVEIGFYFLYEAETSDELELKRAINLLAYSGIGGEKNNTGRTMSDPVFIEGLELTPDENPEMTAGFTNLSLLNLANPDELANITFSQTLLRGGRKSGNGEYSVVRMIAEGALLATDDKMGRLVEIGIDLDGNTAVRNGLAFIVPLTYLKTNE
ncbi:MAG: hypothetical protein Q8O72_05405 [Bacteroidales bacterium]|nr:hypothetical protein [Bacteroidales bacterium]